MEKIIESLEVNGNLVTVNVKSELYFKTEGCISADILLNENRRVIALGDGNDYHLTDEDIEFVKNNIGQHQGRIINTGIKTPIYKPEIDDNEEDILKNIALMVPDGNVLHLPKDVYFDNYQAVKNYLVKNLAKYKNNAFVFPISAAVMQKRILSKDIKNLKKELQFFGTPPEVCEELTNQILGFHGPIRMLEPSAGQGAIIKALLEVRPEAQVTAIEYSDINFEVLKNNYADNDQVSLIHGDFLNHTPDTLGLFDLIIANPPFTGGQDIMHIQHMYKFLKPGGQLITISSESAKANTQKKYQEFRDWADKECGTVFSVNKGAFSTSGTQVSTCIWMFIGPPDTNDNNNLEPVKDLFPSNSSTPETNMWGF